MATYIKTLKKGDDVYAPRTVAEAVLMNDGVTTVQAELEDLQESIVSHTHSESDIYDLDKYTQNEIDSMLSSKASIYKSATPPQDAEIGTLWLNTKSSTLFTKYDSINWVSTESMIPKLKNVTYISSQSYTSGTVLAANMPTHQAGDLLVVVSDAGNGATCSGWSSVNATNNGVRAAFNYKIAQSSSESAGPFVPGFGTISDLVVMVFRNASGLESLQWGVNFSGFTGTTINFPNRTLNTNDLILAVAVAKDGGNSFLFNSSNTPSGMTYINAYQESGDNTMGAFYQTNITSFENKTITTSTSLSYGFAFSLKLTSSYSSITFPSSPIANAEYLINGEYWLFDGYAWYVDDKRISSKGSPNTVTNLWSGSQQQYDAITTKDPNTLYVVLS